MEILVERWLVFCKDGKVDVYKQRGMDHRQHLRWYFPDELKSGSFMGVL